MNRRSAQPEPDPGPAEIAAARIRLALERGASEEARAALESAIAELRLDTLQGLLDRLGAALRRGRAAQARELLESILELAGLDDASQVARTQTLESLGLSLFVCTRLKRRGVHTAGDLCRWSAADVLATPGLGTETLAEIETLLRTVGLELSPP